MRALPIICKRTRRKMSDTRKFSRVYLSVALRAFVFVRTGSPLWGNRRFGLTGRIGGASGTRSTSPVFVQVRRVSTRAIWIKHVGQSQSCMV